MAADPMAYLERPFVIAEIGGNHEGDFEYAKKLLMDAVESGADAVKYQTYKPDKIVSKVENPERNKHFGKFALTDEQFIELAELAEENDILFMSSIWDLDALEVLDPYIKVHKVGSGDLTNYPMIKRLVEIGKPLFVATAMSDLDDIKGLVEFVDSVDPNFIKEKKLLLMQCVAMYGDPRDEYAHLSCITTLKETFPHIPIGYSDHTMGNYTAQIAVALGAQALELHFTDDTTREFRDHHLSITKESMKELLEKIRTIKTLLGSAVKVPEERVETKERIWEFRRACFFKVDVKAGDVVTEENLTTLRPHEGIDAREYFDLLGKKLKVDKVAFEKLSHDDFE